MPPLEWWRADDTLQLIELELNYSRYSPVDWLFLCVFLERTQNLKKLNLRGINFKNQELSQLMHALSLNTSVRELNLSGTQQQFERHI